MKRLLIFKKRVIAFLEGLSLIPENNIIICTHAAVIVAIKYLIIEHKVIFKNLSDEPLEGEIVVIKIRNLKG